ncbi:MAG: hypothetical protein ACLR30_01850 [[Clostridium] leptum]
MLKQKMALLLAAAMLAGAVSGCSNSQQGGEVSADLVLPRRARVPPRRKTRSP